MLVQLVLADEPGVTAVGIVGALAVTLPARVAAPGAPTRWS